MSVTGTVGGNSITGYVRVLHRQQSLCNPTQVITLTLSTNYPHNVDPGQVVSLQENTVQTFTGYVVKIHQERPSYDWVIECHDPYTRCTNFFIEEVLTVGHDANDQPIHGYQAQSTDVWIGYLCGLAGVSYVSSGGTGTVPQGVQIGLRTVHESLTDIIAYSSQYVYADPSGVLHFERISRGYADFTLNNCITVDDTTSDEWTRNVIKVFGYAGATDRVFSMASQGVPGIVPDRVTAVGAPMIQTQPEADRVASYLLSELGDVTRIITAKIEGNPAIRIGKGVRIVHGETDHTDAVTTVIHHWDESGYTTEVTIGERCPRISGWSKRTPLIYAGTTQDGIYISRDGGRNWAAFNTGLPSGNKYVKRIGANAFEEAMSIVNGSLYYTDGKASWFPRTLPAPVNTADDIPAPGHGGLVAVDALGSLGAFSVLTTNPNSSGSDVQQSRSWVYTCESTGSSPSSWKSVELFDSSSSGSGYHTVGIDMKSTTGTPYVIATSGSVYMIHDGNGVQKRNQIRIQDYLDLYSFTPVCGPAPNTGFADWGVESSFYDAPTNTVNVNLIAYTFSGMFKDNLFFYGRKWFGGAQQAQVDGNGFIFWEFQMNFRWDSHNVPGHPPYLWRTSFGYVLGAEEPYFFNVFWSPHSNINFQSITMGEECDSVYHVVGRSPYGDIYGPLGHGGGQDPATPYPFRSVLGAGLLYM